MSIFNILDDTYEESPIGWMRSSAKKKKKEEKQVQPAPVTKTKTDPFLDGFNLFENEEKEEKEHLDFVKNGEKRKQDEKRGCLR